MHELSHKEQEEKAMGTYITCIMMGLKAELQSKEANVLTIKTTTQMNSSLTEVPQIAKELKLIHLKISYKIPHHFHPNERPSQKRTVQCLGHLCSRLL